MSRAVAREPSNSAAPAARRGSSSALIEALTWPSRSSAILPALPTVTWTSVSSRSRAAAACPSSWTSVTGMAASAMQTRLAGKGGPAAMKLTVASITS